MHILSELLRFVIHPDREEGGVRMKWFKHMSHAHSDDKLVSIRSEFGMWGIGVYWSIVERVAEQMKGDNSIPVAVFDVNELCSFCGCKRNKLETFLKHLQNIRGMKWQRNGNIIKIEVSKLLEIKDNYHTDLEETTKQLPSKEVEEEREEEVEKDSTSKPSENDFDAVWKLYPNRQGRKAALRHFLATVKAFDDLTRIRDALRNYLDSANVKKGFIKNGSTWFNEWEDWIEPTTEMMKGNNGNTQQRNPNSVTARATYQRGDMSQEDRELTESFRERIERSRVDTGNAT